MYHTLKEIHRESTAFAFTGVRTITKGTKVTYPPEKHKGPTLSHMAYMA